MDMSRLLSDGAPEREQHPVWRNAGTMVGDPSRAPQPNVARRRSLAGHVTFGFGLYVAAYLLSVVAPE